MKRNQGFTLIEVLIALLVLLIGLLGALALQTRTQQSEMESYQRMQAQVLVDDMVQRISANRANAALYVNNQVGNGSGIDSSNCAAIVGDAVSRDWCEWDAMLKGRQEIWDDGGAKSNVGAMIGARGCIEQVNAATSLYMVSVAWQGLAATAQPTASFTCGKDMYGDENLRRVIASTIRIGDLL